MILFIIQSECLKRSCLTTIFFPKWEHGWLGWTPVHQVETKNLGMDFGCVIACLYLNVWLSNGLQLFTCYESFFKKKKWRVIIHPQGLLTFRASFILTLNRRWLVVWLFLCLYLNLTKLLNWSCKLLAHIHVKQMCMPQSTALHVHQLC